MNSLLEELSRAISARLAADNVLDAVKINDAQTRFELDKEKIAAETALKDAHAAELKAFGELERSLRERSRHHRDTIYEIMFEAGDRSVLTQRPLHHN